MRTYLKPATALLAVLTIALTASAQAGGTKTKKQPKPKPVIYSVVQVDSEVQIVKAEEVTPLKRRLDADFKAASKSYTEAVQAARKKKEKLDLPKPKKAKFKMLKGNFKDMAAAEEYVAKLKEKEAKKSEAKDKDKDKDTDKPKKDKPKKSKSKN